MAGQDPGTRKGERTGDLSPTSTAGCGGWEGGGHSLAHAEEMGAHKAALCPSHCATARAPGSVAGHTCMAGTRELQHQPPLSCRKHSPAPCSAAVWWQQGEGCARLSKQDFSAGHRLILLQPLCPTCAPRLVLGAGGTAHRYQLRAMPCWPHAVPDLPPWGLSDSAAAHHPGKQPGLSPYCCCSGWVQLSEPQTGTEARLTCAVGRDGRSSLQAPSTSTA